MLSITGGPLGGVTEGRWAVSLVALLSASERGDGPERLVPQADQQGAGDGHLHAAAFDPPQRPRCEQAELPARGALAQRRQVQRI